MDITIDQRIIADAVAVLVQRGIVDGVGGWETKKDIESAVQQAVQSAGLPALLHRQLEEAISRESESIVAAVVSDILPSLRVAFQAAMRAALVAMVYGLSNGRPHHMSPAEERRWREVEEQLTAGQKREES